MKNMLSKSYGLARDASKISIDMIDRYHSQQNLSEFEEFGSVHGVHPSKNRAYTSTYNVNISVNPGII